jgi:hypothetical protein
MKPGVSKRIIIVITMLTITGLGRGQQNLPSDKELLKQVFSLDSTLFTAFNTRDIETFKSFFSEDLEFYHDEGGLTGYQHTVDFMKSTAANNNQLKRELVKDKLEVYPIPGYGAMQIGEHRFCHLENGSQDCGTFKFVHVWQLKESKWKITRIVSYGHKPPAYDNKREMIKIPLTKLSRYSGKYNGPRTGDVFAKTGQDCLILSIKGKEFIIYPETETMFFSKESDLTFEFINTKMIVREKGQVAEELNLVK